MGGDDVVPQRRIYDEALYFNQRDYAELPTTSAAGQAFSKRYFLSDDYYAALLPIPYKGRELYLPQLAIGRLVEQPAEITTMIDTFIGQPVTSALLGVTTG